MNPLPALESAFRQTAAISLQATLLIALLLLARPLLKKFLPPRWVYLLWFVALARLVLIELPTLPAAEATQPLAAPVVAVQNLQAQTLSTFAALPLPAAPTALPWPQRARALLAILWLAGALAFLLYTTIAHLRWVRRLAHATPIASPEALALMADCCREMNVRPVRLLQLPGDISPAVTGLFHPTILLPGDFLQRFTPEELRWTLLHELAHLRRGDLPVQFLCQLLQALHWFNPFVWLAFACLRHDRELACDAHVLDLQNSHAPRAYGHTLIKVAETYPRSALAPGLLGISEEPPGLVERVQNISTHRRPRFLWTLCGLLLCALLAYTFLTRLDQPAHKATAKFELHNSYIPAQIEIMQSSDVVMPTIRKLGLDKTWAKRFGSNEEAWTLPEVMDRISKILTVQFKENGIIYVTVQCDPPQEAADIANALVDQYKTMLDAQDSESNISRARDNFQSTIEGWERTLVSDQKAVEKLQAEAAHPPDATGGLNQDANSANNLAQQQFRLDEAKARQQERIKNLKDSLVNDQNRLDDTKAQQERAIAEAKNSFQSSIQILARAY